MSIQLFPNSIDQTTLPIDRLVSLFQKKRTHKKRVATFLARNNAWMFKINTSSLERAE
jgi:hypothetical protein